ncbi:type II toxin-antitoxin system mRNA interferase toxin, RelE/StbE family [Candidatus Peregrinibacteria bacterium CG11_big_fil_rev_8_21_14_0_20_46_8]|nr:MAG: type II toxin-antitoxin system mRNA interferase toxin, RelE/StbE family [Candidatus Peregrinibacteria bacterium CG11_big_fil_rev_8_21_14_0_20_46_8]
MKKYNVLFTKQAMKDAKSLSPKLKKKLQDILMEVVLEDPSCGKKLVGDLKGNFSYRIDLKNRIVYSVDKKKKIVYIKRARTHYGD